MPSDRADRLLNVLNEAQREAVNATSGPLVILAGRGTGRIRVMSGRAAYAIETGVVLATRILFVTFTDNAATEVVERMAVLGHRSVMARTFHSARLPTAAPLVAQPSRWRRPATDPSTRK